MVETEETDKSTTKDPPRDASILIVDDRPANIEALQAILEPLGVNLVTALSGREALRHVLKSEFAVILMDVQMPEMDGYETARIIREREASRWIPIIFVTAVNTDERYAFQGYSVGAVDYITKPFNGAMLAAKVSVFIELFRKERQLRAQAERLHEKEMQSLQMMQREREQELEQEKIRSVNRLLEERVQERTAELESFCYAVSHDLRTPLRSIDGYSATLEDDLRDFLGVEAKDALKRIRRAAHKMDELISALLALSRITRTELHPKTVDITELAGSIVQELQASQKQRPVECVIQAGMQTEGDPILIRSLLFNLISNAWKFTATNEQPLIEIGSYENETGKLVYYVKDNGVGFDPTYAHKLFTPFERLHDPEMFPGSGIGLATVLRIVRKHGGNVWAEGVPEKGAQFFFFL